MGKFGDIQPVMVIVYVEVVVLHVGENVSLVTKHQVGYEEGLEGVVEIWNESEVVQGNEGTELHVLDEGPEGQETDVLEVEHEELEDDDTKKVPVSLLGVLSHVNHKVV